MTPTHQKGQGTGSSHRRFTPKCSESFCLTSIRVFCLGRWRWKCSGLGVIKWILCVCVIVFGEPKMFSLPLPGKWAGTVALQYFRRRRNPMWAFPQIGMTSYLHIGKFPSLPLFSTLQTCHREPWTGSGSLCTEVGQGKGMYAGNWNICSGSRTPRAKGIERGNRNRFKCWSESVSQTCI